jgi:hypothetical protein
MMISLPWCRQIKRQAPSPCPPVGTYISKSGLSPNGPWSLEDGKLNDWNGGRGFYYKDHDGHAIELMTMPQ